ncbi:hypothetical protein SAMN05880574_1542 [Chryseobacterium sp. RU37D]|nr:hypothetical protein SAMN05880574_1542 [Chryseobacterium sp. RU37D]
MLNILLLVIVVLLIIWNIYDNIQYKKILKKHIDLIDKQAECIRELKKFCDQCSIFIKNS